MSKVFYYLLAILLLSGCAAPLSGRFPDGIPDEMVVAGHHPGGHRFRAHLREWMGPPPGPVEDATVQPPHSKFHPVPTRPVFGPDTAPPNPQFPTLRPVEQSTQVRRQSQPKPPEPQVMQPAPAKENPAPAQKSARQKSTKKVPQEASQKKPVHEASFSRTEPKPTVTHTSTLPRFRHLRR